MPAHFSTNRLVRYAILAWHLWHVVVFAAVKSVCLLGLPPKNVPPCKHMCHIPSPYILSCGLGSPIPHAWSFASHYPIENKHCAWWKCVWCTRLISVTKSVTSESKLHIVVCVQATLPVSMRVKAPAAPLITMSNRSSAGRNQGGGGWVCWLSFLTSAKTPSPFHIPSFTWVCSLSFRSLNARFENCLSDWEAALCIQTQTCGQSDIKSTCAEFRTQAHRQSHEHTVQ